MHGWMVPSKEIRAVFQELIKTLDPEEAQKMTEILTSVMKHEVFVHVGIASDNRDRYGTIRGGDLQ